MTAADTYEPPVAIPGQGPGSGMPDATPGESVNTFLERQGRAAEQMNRMNLEHGNGMTFSHQYTIAGKQDAQYRTTGDASHLGVPESYMPNYGTYDRETNPGGFNDPMTAGHHIPNGATLARAGWVWEDAGGKAQFVPAQKGYSDLRAPGPPPAPGGMEGPGVPPGDGSAALPGTPVPPAEPPHGSMPIQD